MAVYIEECTIKASFNSGVCVFGSCVLLYKLIVFWHLWVKGLKNIICVAIWPLVTYSN